MDKELIINATESGVELALLEDGKLVELQHQKTNNNFTVGDILIGKIRKMMPGLNAAFIDIGIGQDGFLHFSDVDSSLEDSFITEEEDDDEDDDEDEDDHK